MKLNKAITLILIALITLLGIHVVYQASEGMRADVTQDNLFSLTDGTKQILYKMHSEGVQPIDLKLYSRLFQIRNPTSSSTPTHILSVSMTLRSGA